MKWIEVGITTTSQGLETMAQILYEAGVKGVVIEDRADVVEYINKAEGWDYVDESILEKFGCDAKVKGYLPEDKSTYDSILFINEKLEWLSTQDLGIDIGPGKVEISSVDEQDWVNSWKKYFKPFKVSDRVVVKPSWEEYIPGEQELVIELDPGMAFGTGTHETTMLCIRALEKLVHTSHRLLDVGCGTGILSIAAVLLGANYAVAVDIDADAVRVAQENAHRNGVDGRIKCMHSNLLDEVMDTYDLVVANIASAAVIELIAQCRKYIRHGGMLIVSGILMERVDEVLDAMKHNGYEIVSVDGMGEWAAVVGLSA